jgi:hypothetical protein
LQASDLRTSKVASTSTISLIDYAISSDSHPLSSPKLPHPIDQRSTKIENPKNKRIKEPSSQKLESHSQASSFRAPKVTPINTISDKDCIGQLRLSVSPYPTPPRISPIKDQQNLE